MSQKSLVVSVEAYLDLPDDADDEYISEEANALIIESANGSIVRHAVLGVEIEEDV